MNHSYIFNDWKRQSYWAKKSLINFTETLLFDEVMNQLNPNYVVMEVL